jgi:hypothetical protein
MIHSLSVTLQSPHLDLGRAVLLVDALKGELQEFRRNVDSTEDGGLHELYAAAENQCRDIDIDTTLTAARSRRRKLPERLQSAYVDTSVGNRSEISSRDIFKIEIVLPIIDCLVSELNRRFSEQACDVMQGIQALNPSGDIFLNITILDKFATLYNSDLEDLHHELNQLKRMIERNEAKETSSSLHTILDLVVFLEPLQMHFMRHSGWQQSR